MKVSRIESLVSWLWTGAILIAVGLYFLVRGWFLTELGSRPLGHRGAVLDPHVAVGGGVFFLFIGLAIVVAAVIGKLRSER